MRPIALVVLVAMLHTVAVSALVFMQGCGRTTGPMKPGTPAEIVMPPTKAPGTEAPKALTPKPMARPTVLEPVMTKTYKVQPGDTLSGIAKRAGVSWRELVEINKLSSPDKIVVGKTLILPPYASDVAPRKPRASAPKASSKPSAPVGSGGRYVVVAGDSLSRIAARNGTTTKALMSANNLSNPNKIFVGQKLTIPGAGSAPAAAPEAPSVFSTDASAVETASEVDDAMDAVTFAPAAPSETIETVTTDIDASDTLDYTVLPGDTLDDIAKLFLVSKEDVMQLNGLTSDDVKSGQKLRIPPSRF